MPLFVAPVRNSFKPTTPVIASEIDNAGQAEICFRNGRQVL
jgi:hypothetical protein